MTGNRRILSDLLAVICLVVLTDIFVLVPGLSESSIRTALGLPMVLFLPGYALIAALFPAKNDIDGIERIALSFGLSIAVVPLIGLCLNYTPWGIRLLPILISISAFTLVMCGIAYFRRAALQDEEAYSVPFVASLLAIKEEALGSSDSTLDKLLTVVLLFSVLVSAGTLVYVIVTPKEGEHFTEFYILGPGGKADNYTTQYAPWEKGTVIVGIVNHEYKTENYTLDVRLKNTSLPLPADQKYITLGHNETWEKPVTIAPPFEGENMKLEFLLYNESVKTTPYRDLHLWVNVSEGNKK